MNNGVRLLVIDDDDINVFIMKKIVEKTGYKTNMASKSNGQEAIDYLKELTASGQPFPDLILIDINMPVLNGWEFLNAYNLLFSETKADLYMLSSSVYEDDVEKTKTYKMVKGFICKPLSIDQIAELIQEAGSETIK